MSNEKWKMEMKASNVQATVGPSLVIQIDVKLSNKD